MRTIDSATQDELDRYRAATRDMILFDFGADGLHGFWTGAGTFEHGGGDYHAAGSLLQIEADEEAEGNEANAITISLRAVPEAGLTPDVLGEIETIAYKQAPVTIFTAYFHPDTRELLSVEPEFDGILDQIIHDQSEDGSYRLLARLESLSRDHSKTGYRRRSDADQKLINATDGGLRHAATVTKEKIYWGRKGPVGSGNASGTFAE